MSYQAMDARQFVRTIPEQILASRVLEMSVTELQSFVEQQMLENPALVIDDEHRCPLCGAPTSDAGVCTLCGSMSDAVDGLLRSNQGLLSATGSLDIYDDTEDDNCDPFCRVAAETDLAAYLHRQSAIAFKDKDRIVADYIIDSLDHRGYFCESLVETASLFGLCVPEFRTILDAVQEFDPPGIAATSVQECLLLQLRQADISAPAKELAARIITECWRELSRLRWKAISEKLGRPVQEVRDAVRIIGDKLTPYPASLYRPPWQELAPSRAVRVVPDAVIRCLEAPTDDGRAPNGTRAAESGDAGFRTPDGTLTCEVVDFRFGSLGIDKLYSAALEQVRKTRAGCSDEEKRHICEQVDKARCVLDAVALRKTTLARLCVYLASEQRDFVLKGAQGLKPMTQKQVARKLGVHESTISRAVRGKYVQLPSGEVVPMDRFFDSALPIKDRIAELVAADAGPGALTDGQIAARLAEQGIRVARRTVAKYRGQLQLPPAQLRAA